jgi:hypothetical protein
MVFGRKKSKKKDVDTMALYNILGVEKKATPEEIKKAYRKLAIKLHPDKNGGTAEAQAKFTAMKNAYEVLSDQRRRYYYDNMGDQGVEQIDQLTDMTPEQMMMAMQMQLADAKLSQRAAMCCCITLGFSILALIFIMFALKVDGSISLNWSAVFWPIWLLNIPIAFGTFQFLSGMPMPEEGQDFDKSAIMREKLLIFVQTSLFLAFEIMLTLRLDGSSSLNWILVLLPWILIEIMWLGVLCAAYAKLLGNTDFDNVEKKAENIVNKISVPKQMTMGLLRIAFAILIAGKQDRWDGLADASWWSVFGPVWAGFGVVVLFLVLEFRSLKEVRAEVEQRRQEKAMGDAATMEEEHDVMLPEPSPGDICCLLIALIPISVTAAKAAGGDFSAFMIFVPILLFICCGWCACWTSICMAGRPDDEGMDGEDEESGLFNDQDDHDLESGGGSPTPGMRLSVENVR